MTCNCSAAGPLNLFYQLRFCVSKAAEELHLVTEETPLENPFWEYSRNKIACEERLMQAYRVDGFPVGSILSFRRLMSMPIGFGIRSSPGMKRLFRKNNPEANAAEF